MTSMAGEAEPNKYNLINFEETELRLGLPGAGEGEIMKNSGKRGFSETVDLKLNFPFKESDMDQSEKIKNSPKEMNLLTCTTDPANPPASKEQVVGWPPVRSLRKNTIKSEVVGWPPVRSFRKNVLTEQKESNNEEGVKVNNGASFVKVSMDGAPYLRKVDLKIYKSYQELSNALGKMFSSFTIGDCGSQGMKDFMNENKLIDLLNGSDYVPTYEDKDGDWMLVGDVPWEMFVDSCKRLRIMKGSEAIGLAPRAVEKCKNRN